MSLHGDSIERLASPVLLITDEGGRPVVGLTGMGREASNGASTIAGYVECAICLGWCCGGVARVTLVIDYRTAPVRAAFVRVIYKTMLRGRDYIPSWSDRMAQRQGPSRALRWSHERRLAKCERVGQEAE